MCVIVLAFPVVAQMRGNKGIGNHKRDHAGLADTDPCLTEPWP